MTASSSRLVPPQTTTPPPSSAMRRTRCRHRHVPGQDLGLSPSCKRRGGSMNDNVFIEIGSTADDDSIAFLRHVPSLDVPESSKVLNTPMFPNLSLISSSSTEAIANN
ncbi:hypothetical protein Fmac_026440 [Flemingia macrophylla]|uniref:Uncharacterized protein n=1 Tax=Flemingia macrophylla TaxID=520843 RepID=A0ABD1LEX8_9FABA